MGLLLVVACGAPRWPGDPDLYGLDFVPPDTDGWDQSLSFEWGNDLFTKVRLKYVIEQVAEYYGHDPHEVDGLRVILVRDAFPCVDGNLASGCMNYGDNTITLAMLLNFTHPCLEGTAIAHELLHYFQGDTEAGRHHEGPEWDALPALEQVLLQSADARPVPGYCTWQ